MDVKDIAMILIGVPMLIVFYILVFGACKALLKLLKD